VSITDIQEHIREIPFVPFRLHLSDGSHFDIPHPDFISLIRTTAFVSTDVKTDDIPERMVRVAADHITRLEPLAGAATPQ
jgi:hypothetical protein